MMGTGLSIFVVGASAGGVEALVSIIRDLTADFPGSNFIVMHLAPDYHSLLPEILQRVSKLPVCRPEDGEPISSGRIYVAIPNRHLMLEKDRIRLTSGQKENRFRPAVDVLFRSTARAYGPGVVGVVLTGALDDGTPGLYAIKERGGIAIVQDPEEAFCPGMPRSAIEHVAVDHVVRLAEIGPMLNELARRPMDAADEDYQVPTIMDSEVGIALGDNGRMREIMDLGGFTPYTCPECHGVLLEIPEDRIVRFRCHTGHAFTLSHLLSELTRKNEDSLMSALRSLEETEALLVHAAEHLQGSESPGKKAAILEKVEHVRRQAALVKQAAVTNLVVPMEALAEDDHRRSP